MQKLLLLGDEAIAQAAMDAGLTGAYAYPGTPSTEILEYIQRSQQAKERNIHRQWSANEKTALEAAIGMSYAGKRALVCMKHVGLNVAADPFMNCAITGVNGGLVIISADDPSMHSSQNEQDSRYYGKFALIPVLEPADQQEAYDMTRFGFDLSEKHKVPVLIRITTRLAHSRAGIQTRGIIKEKNLKLPMEKRQFVLLPSIARVKYRELLDKQSYFDKESDESIFNKYIDFQDKSLGIITSGIAYNYIIENYPHRRVPHPLIRIGQYPIPRKKIKKLIHDCHEILVIEEGYPFIEEMLNGFSQDHKIKGKLDGTLPRDGELNPNIVASALKINKPVGKDIPGLVADRPPSMCKGCGHIDVYLALNEALEAYEEGRVFADIGCYTLGALPPYNAINSTVDMGASIPMAKGAADAGLVPSVAVIGDSTFIHSGITGLLDVVSENSPIVVIISDNSSTAMTGGQIYPGLGDLELICKSLGVPSEHLRVIVPLKKNHNQNVKILKEELAYHGTSVIIAQRECVQIGAKQAKEKHKK